MTSTPTSKLTDAEITAALADLNGWRREGDKLFREYRFADFVTAFAFMAGVALVAERMNHHPEWFNVYGTVRVHLSTHDAGGLTHKDLELAGAMDRLAAQLAAPGG
jgi:4a-hydroxytetrahydrobiopterin dehydratase